MSGRGLLKSGNLPLVVFSCPDSKPALPPRQLIIVHAPKAGWWLIYLAGRSWRVYVPTSIGMLLRVVGLGEYLFYRAVSGSQSMVTSCHCRKLLFSPVLNPYVVLASVSAISTALRLMHKKRSAQRLLPMDCIYNN